MKKYVPLVFMLCLGCGTDPTIPSQFDFKAPARTIQLNVVVDKYSKVDCKLSGGMWIYGEIYSTNRTAQDVTALSGCVEPNKKESEKKNETRTEN